MGTEVRSVVRVPQVRAEYTSARVIGSNLAHRLAGTRYARHPGYIPPEADLVLDDGSVETLVVRDADVRFLDRVRPAVAVEHADLIRRARCGDAAATGALCRRNADTAGKIAARFESRALIENEYVVPYTTGAASAEKTASHKGAILLDLFQRGFATADFSILTSEAYGLSGACLETAVRDSVRNLEVLSGRRLGDADNPLLVAIRSALPEYVPGFMPTYLNAGFSGAMLEGLGRRYGAAAARRIRVNSRRTLLAALDPASGPCLDREIRPGLTTDQNDAIARRVEDAIATRGFARLLEDPFAQILFFVERAYAYYADHQGVLRNFTLRDTAHPAVILQRMVCSVIDDESYAGVVYSRHPQRGTGVFLQFARTIYGEDLMTGLLPGEERHFLERDEARAEFPAVYHFWPRLHQLEDLFRAPVMVEFTGVHGTFTILQVNAGELSGAGMLTAVMDMHRRGRIGAERVRELIRPYHVRQIESDAIDPRSLHALRPFARGVAVLPRSDVTGTLYFSVADTGRARADRKATPVVLAKARFTPEDAIDMQRVNAICSLSPAAIHVVTTAQTLGIPALLNLEEAGVRIDVAGRRLEGPDGSEIREGEWVTVSSKHRTLFAGRAVYAPARLLRLMAGEAVDIAFEDRPRFERLAADYREYRGILEAVDASGFRTLQDLGRAIRHGELRADDERTAALVNRCFDLCGADLAEGLLDTRLGTHLINRTAFAHLSPDRRARLLRDVAARARARGLSGYHAGAFVIGSLVQPHEPRAFWALFTPAEAGFLLNEWVLYQKYVRVLEDVGEKRTARARDYILSQGLGEILLTRSDAQLFHALRASGVDLDAVKAGLPEASDSQTADLIDLLRQLPETQA